jgi:hypothetical protein
MKKCSIEKNGHGVLRRVLEAAYEEYDYSRADLTVLSVRVDPYRLDTDAGHRDGAWAAKQLNAAFGKNRRTHWRGLHYAIVARGNVRKPDGEFYRNTDSDWEWLLNVAAKSARWLGYIPFERIGDNRNAEPMLKRKARVMPNAWLSVGLNIDVPDVAEINPLPVASGFVGRQAFIFVIFGEKGSLLEVLEPLARKYEADLYLGSGEISDTHLHMIAKDAAEDGRPLVVFTLSDCDPAGHQMPVSIARKLQALRDLLFPTLRFEVVPVALTVGQVREFDLPSTPLKETEKRASRWRNAFGVEQTEIDALATLRPDVLRDIVDNAFSSYFDTSLSQRVEEAKARWLEDAEEVISNQINDEVLSELREQASLHLGELRDEIDHINEQIQLATDAVTLPEIEVPQPEVEQEVERQALIKFDHSWIEQTLALIAHKSYGK